MAKYWQQHELWDGTYTLEDLMDWAEMWATKQENELLAREAAERQRQQQN